MKSLAIVLLIASAAWSARAHAVVSPVVIDFEDIDMGFDSPKNVGPTLAYSNAGNSGVNVTIVSGHLTLFVDDLTSYPGTTGQALLDAVESIPVPHVTTILFGSPVKNFQMSAGDLGTDNDGSLDITAYDAADSVLGSDTEPWGLNKTPPFATLSVGATGIRKIVYSSGGTLPNTTYIDNLTFTPVPEPASWSILGVAAVAAIAARSRRRP